MHATSQTRLLLTVFLFLFYFHLNAQVKEPKPLNEDWTKSYEPFRIVGNLYYVGTYDLACYLITTQQGHILINTGIASSALQIESNINKLGFKFSDVKILLTTQAHWDHTGALTAIKTKTGAQMMANEKDAIALEDGGQSDYAFGGNGIQFEPVKVDRLLKPNDIITLGNVRLKMLHHPGHTKGSSSYFLNVKDADRSYDVLIANLPTIIVDQKLSEVASYPTIASDMASSLESLKNLKFDIWLASHASQFKMHNKRKPTDPYNPKAFFDREGYDKALAELQIQFELKR